MDMVERYLQAVRFWLPRAGQEDIVAELREDLRCQREEAEARLGRPLDEAETADLLRRTGSPLKVAGNYLPQRPWLDPALALIFGLVIRIVMLWVLVPVYAVIAIPTALFSAHPLAATAATLQSFAGAEISALGCITLVFLLLGRAQDMRPALAGPGWDPRKLPKLRPADGPRPIPRVNSVAEVVTGLLFAAWWLETPGWLPAAWTRPWSILLDSGALWADLRGPWFLPILVLTLANVLVACVCLANPHLVRLRRAYGVLSGLLLAAFCGLPLAAHRIEVAESVRLLGNLGPGPHNAVILGRLAEAGLGLLLAMIAVGGLIQAVSEAVRLAWSRRPSQAPR